MECIVSKSVDHLVTPHDVLPFEGTSIGWRIGQRILTKFSKEECKVLLPEEQLTTYKYLMGGNEDRGAKTFSAALSDRTKWQWTQTKTQGIPSEQKETPFYCEGWSNTTTGFPERLRSSWRCSKT